MRIQDVRDASLRADLVNVLFVITAQCVQL